MELPVGLSPDKDEDEFQSRYILRINKSLYGLKQAGHNWFQKFLNDLIDRDFVQSNADKYILFRDGCIIITYVDDCIIMADSMQKVDDVIKSLHEGDEHTNIISY